MTSSKPQRKSPADVVAVTGIGATEQGTLTGRDADDIAIEALGAALRDAGLKKEDLDGLVTCKSFGGGAGIDTEIARRAGLRPAYSATLDYGSSNFSLHLAASVIRAGLATTVACVYGTNQRSVLNTMASSVASDAGSPGAPYGFVHISGPAAIAFKRHQYLYGTTEEQLGHFAIAARAWARHNPRAIFRKPLDMAEYLAMPYIVEPLRRPDMTMLSDGGAALILTTADRAAALRQKPVHIIGMAQYAGGLRLYQDPDHLMRPWLKDLAKKTFASAGLTQKDIDLFYVQDPTSIWTLQMLEAYGFCGEGEAGPFAASGAMLPGGKRPVNTNGGQLAEAYMWGWLHAYEAVEQLRGNCAERQVSNATVALYASTMAFEKGAATVFSSELP